MEKTRWPLRRAAIIMGTAAISLTACGTVHYSSAAATSATSARACTKIAGWATPEYGDRFKAANLRLDKDAPATVNGIHPELSGSTAFAYRSEPQNVSVPGIYTFNFGPLNPAFKWGTTTKAVAFGFPPDLPADFAPAPVPAKVVAIDGKRYFRVAFKMTARPQQPAGTAACSGLVVWAY
jgi:hypothetical protein